MWHRSISKRCDFFHRHNAKMESIACSSSMQILFGMDSSQPVIKHNLKNRNDINNLLSIDYIQIANQLKLSYSLQEIILPSKSIRCRRTRGQSFWYRINYESLKLRVAYNIHTIRGLMDLKIGWLLYKAKIQYIDIVWLMTGLIDRVNMCTTGRCYGFASIESAFQSVSLG